MMYDINTSNLSFLDVSFKLRQFGVKNNKFMLALNDSTLSGVNPYDPNLSNMQKAQIFAEICANWWYFLREVVRIPQIGNNNGVQFGLNVGNLAAAYCSINNINHLFMVPRQIGKTVVEVTFSLWVYCFSGSYNKETYLHKAQSGSIDNLKRLKQYKELLPYWLQQMVDDRQDKDNLEEKFSYKRNNTIVALSSAHNDAAADKLGRGSSTPMIYLDEFAFLERNKIVWNALVPAWMTSAQNAKLTNSPYGIRITTTPNNLSLDQAKFCHDEILSKACRFTYFIYDIPEDQLADYVHNNSDNDFMFIQYTWQECGKTQEWYNTQARLIGDRNIIKRELENVWPEASEGNVFEETQLEIIRSKLKPIVLTLTINGYGINFYEKPDFLLNYIISCDVSGGLSLDRSVMMIIHPGDFHLVGLFYNSRIDTENFKMLIYKTATEYFIHSIINIENNSYGLNILDSLMKDAAIEPRLYRETVEKLGEKIMTDGHAVRQKTKKVVYGTQTNKESRKLMFDLLGCIVDDEPEVFVSEDFYTEIKNLIRTKQGKPEARPGFHDDIIMSYLITRYSLNFGQCFQKMFHISAIPTKHNIRNGGYLENSLLHNFGNFIDSANSSAYMNDAEQDYSIYSYINNLNQKSELQGYENPEQIKKNQVDRVFDFISRLNSDDSNW